MIFFGKLWCCVFILVSCLFVGSCNVSKEKKEILKFVDDYFDSWSENDMTKYKSLFHTKAMINDVRKNGDVIALSLNPFIKSQAYSKSIKGLNLTEKATKIDINIENDYAHVRTDWTMYSNSIPKRRGYDFFTLYKYKDGWKIMHLLYYTTKEY